MPRLDNERDIITRVTVIEQMTPQTSSTPRYLAIRGVSPSGPREMLISEDAARELSVRLAEMLPIGDSQ
jgi:hypothetical protein